ncbi:MAG: hypothetical protein F4X75_22315 [Gemmatimonadetes bacterium]|nr:hypothetical protein [Gemmatimonadota bacterium]
MITHSDQLSLFADKTSPIREDTVKSWGTFKDSLRAPVHRWFTYPAGFSYKAVAHSFERFGIAKGMSVYDPFMGSGTTNVTAKAMGIDSVGTEAHPFVYEIAKAKMEWEVDKKAIRAFIDYLNINFESRYSDLNGDALCDHFPELVLKCYKKETLGKLLTLKKIYDNYEFHQRERMFIFVVLTALLREISSAATGWPYIAPKKEKITSEDKDALLEFNSLAMSMLDDLTNIRRQADEDYLKSKHCLIFGSSTDVSEYLSNESVNHVFTSPPYLNNFDYSDRTRLELYFWGFAKNWKDITDKVRSRLMTSATTQISRNDPKYLLDEEIKTNSPEIARFIQEATDKLSELRKIKGGKKSYDLMVIGYFNDIYKVIKEVYRVLKPNSSALFVLGDSAPYGVHIPTDRLIGEIGCSIGFKSYSLEVLRKRGDKWKANPQRHGVSLQESIVILEKE